MNMKILQVLLQLVCCSILHSVNADISLSLDIKGLKQQLTSQSEQERERVKDDLIRLYGKLSQEDQERVTAVILNLLAEPVRSQEVWNDTSTPRNIAVFLAGELRVQAAIPYLIDLLRPREGQVISHIMDRSQPRVNGEIIGPAARALIKIGAPAEGALKDKLHETEDEKLKSVIRYILKEIQKREARPDFEK